MAFSSGVFSRLYNWATDLASGAPNHFITASRMDGEMDGFATGLSSCLLKDGTQTVTANIPMATYRFTGLGAGSARTDSASMVDVQNAGSRHATSSGTDTVTLTLAPASTAYAAGQAYNFKAGGTNTGAVTLNVNSLGAKAVQKNLAALVAGDITQNDIVTVVYDGTQFQMVSPARTPGLTAIEFGHATDTTLTRASAGDINIEGNIVYRAGGTDVPVTDGGTGAGTFTDGGVLLGSGTSAITAMAALSDGEFIVGNGTTDPVAESGATVRTSLGLGTFAVEDTNAVPAITLAGAITGADQTVSAINLVDYGEVTVAHGNTGATETLDISAGAHHTATIDEACAFTFSNPTASDELSSFTLSLTNGGAFTVTWPGSVDWAGASAPDLTASGLDLLVFMTYDGGTIWHGMLASADTS